MKLPFLDRQEEAARFRRLVDRSEGSLGVVYGRRRCGKSRLLREVLLAQLEAKARRLPAAAGREIVPALWLKAPAAESVVTPRQVLDVLR